MGGGNLKLAQLDLKKKRERVYTALLINKASRLAWPNVAVAVLKLGWW